MQRTPDLSIFEDLRKGEAGYMFEGHAWVHVVTEVCFLRWQEMERKKEKQPGNSFKMRTSAENFRVVIVIMGVLHAITKTSSN